MRKRSQRNEKKAVGKRGVVWTDHLVVVAIAVTLTLFGLLMILESSAVTALRVFDDKYHFVRNQAMWAGMGLCTMLIVSRIDYRRLYALAVPLLLGVLVLLLLVFIPGIGVRASGAHRWIDLGFFQFQPTELAKLVLIIYLSAWFSHKEQGRLLPFVILLGIVLGLIILEPDLGTAVIIGVIAVVLYFLSGAPLKHFGFLLPAGFVATLLLALVSPYRYQRLVTFFDPGSDQLGASYHVRQLLLALGSGGWLGVGIGKSRQKFSYLPEAMTDSIFAIIGEEVGFIGASIVVMLFFGLFIYGFRIARRATNRFGQLLATGITAWLAIQTIINLGATVALFPLTGVPLIFLSYGGSVLLVTYMALGILINISRQSK